MSPDIIIYATSMTFVYLNSAITTNTDRAKDLFEMCLALSIEQSFCIITKIYCFSGRGGKTSDDWPGLTFFPLKKLSRIL